MPTRTGGCLVPVLHAIFAVQELSLPRTVLELRYASSARNMPCIDSIVDPSTPVLKRAACAVIHAYHVAVPVGS